MNVRLSCASSSYDGKSCYIIEKGGKEVERGFYSIEPSLFENPEDLLEVIYKGLLATRPFISHTDLLVVEASNKTILGWLRGDIEQDMFYIEAIDRAVEVIESLDCTIKFICNKKTIAEKVIEKEEVKVVVKGSSVADLMSEFAD